MVAVMFLCGVVIWQPLFIPMLALLLISVVLLIGALIGQDRMARIVLYLLKRFVWADPSLGRLLQRLLPKRWHGILYRPVTEADAWDGFVDPSFEARLAKIRKP
jgi:cytochrome b subunit of formate dehydrogenase